MVDVAVALGGLRVGGTAPLVTLETTPPLFVVGSNGRSAWATLLSELRLSGAVDPAAIDIITRGLLDSRLTFFRRLGESRVAWLSDIPFVNNPITTNQTLRAVASSTEVMLIRKDLLRKMRSLFADGNAAMQAYNNEGLIREQPDVDIETEISRLDMEILENMELLSGTETVGNESHGILVGTIEPLTAPPRPGSSVWPQLRY
jgi:hypothetical protein